MSVLDSFSTECVFSYCDVATLIQMRNICKFWKGLIDKTYFKGCNVDDFLKLHPQQKAHYAVQYGSLELLEYCEHKYFSYIMWNPVLKQMMTTKNTHLLPVIESANKRLLAIINDCLTRYTEPRLSTRIRFRSIDWNIGLIAAASVGSVENMLLMEKKGAGDWNRALGQICSHGYEELVPFVVSKGAHKFNWGLSAACSANNEKMANLMITYGAHRCLNCEQDITAGIPHKLKGRRPRNSHSLP